jgi:hypothetical protein
MSTCPNCGRALAGDSAFCTHCGTSLTASAPTAGSTAAAGSPPTRPASAPYAAGGPQPPYRPVYAAQSVGSSAFVEFITFRKMITPVAVRILFWAFEVSNAIFWVWIMFNAGDDWNISMSGDIYRDEGASAGSVVGGLIGLVVWALVIRVCLEFLVHVFNINREVVEIRKRMEQ